MLKTAASLSLQKIKYPCGHSMSKQKKTSQDSAKRVGKSRPVGKSKPEGKFRPTTKPKAKEASPKPVPRKAVTKSPQKKDGIRLNKYIANSGVCSRREADTYIATGLVSVNGKIVNEMGYKVQLSDDVRFDGRRLNPEPITLSLIHI